MLQKEWSTPDFLKGNSSEEIHSRMLAALPPEMDKSEGGFAWDFTKPTALEKAKLVEFTLSETIKNLFPLFAEGNFLDMHAVNRGIVRREAGFAVVTVKITGIPGTIIPAGFQVSTEATSEKSGIIFSLNEETTIPESGVVFAKATCQSSGPAGNIAAAAIRLQLKPMKGILSIRNEEPSSGGYEAESDESLRERIAEYDLSQGISFVGSPSDYRRWALSVPGVGNVSILSSEDGVVTLTITDSNGHPAEEELCTAVYNTIMQPQNPLERLAPINAKLKVIPPQVLQIHISASLLLNEGYQIEAVKEAFIQNLIAYFASDSIGNTIRYHDIGAILIGLAGVSDYQHLTVNGQTNNVIVPVGSMPVIDSSYITLTASDET